jgi:N-acylneuraminate cytidylyltransferase
MSLSVLAVITARSGSKGILNKNMTLIGDVPLIDFSINSIKKSKLITKSIVSTDSEVIGSHCSSMGIEFPFLRPQDLASDEAKSIDVIIHAINYFKNLKQYFDYVLILQPTAPFRSDNLIDDSIIKLRNSGKNCLISVKEVSHQYHPNWQFALNKENNTLSKFQSKITARRQELSPTFVRDGAIYLIKVDYLLRNNTLFDDEMDFIIDLNSPSINIDTNEDLIAATKYYNEKC